MNKVVMSVILAAAVFAVLVATVSIAYGEEKELSSGWNLISGTDESVVEFSADNLCVTAVYTFSDGKWLSWFPTDQFQGYAWAQPIINKIDFMDSKKGYWVYCDKVA